MMPRAPAVAQLAQGDLRISPYSSCVDAGDPADLGNFLNGGTGDDLILAGPGDVATGDAGADRFVLGAWSAEGGIARIADFEAGIDALVLVLPEGHAGVVTVAPGPAAGEMSVRLDGVTVAIVAGAPDLAPGDIAIEHALPDADLWRAG